jgi:ferritin-like metal-binding protein YciE
MAVKRITISLTEEQYDNFREVLPVKANISEVICDMIDKFIAACEKYGDEFVMDVMCSRGGYSIQKIIK